MLFENLKRLQLFGNPKVPIWMQGPMDWYEAVGVELAVTWGTVSRFQWEVRNMRYVRAQTCWLEATHEDLRDRRRAALGIARGLISSKDQAELEIDNLYPMIPVDSISSRLANEICVAYDEPPERTFVKDSDEINSGFEDFYETLQIDEVMDQAYRAALFVNTVLILWSEEENKFLVLTPEYFRIADDGIWVARRTGYTAAERSNYMSNTLADGEIVYDVWSDDMHEVRNHSGMLMVSQCEENPYGCFPGALLKLMPSNDLYGAGIAEAAEVNAATNVLELFAMRIAHYQGFSIAVGTNIRNESGGTGAKNNVRLGPGAMLNLQDPDGTARPDFKFVSPDGKFEELQEFKRKKISAFERNHSLPGFLIDENVMPPSGVALQVLERPLVRYRKKHVGGLRRAEKDLLRFIQVLARRKKRPALVADTFEIRYADPQLFTDPTQDLEFDLNKASNGLLSPSALAQKYYGVKKGMTDDEAIQMMQENKQRLAFLAPVEVKAT